jgi:hypothetical protein
MSCFLLGDACLIWCYRLERSISYQPLFLSSAMPYWLPYMDCAMNLPVLCHASTPCSHCALRLLTCSMYPSLLHTFILLYSFYPSVLFYLIHTSACDNTYLPACIVFCNSLILNTWVCM